MMRKAAAAMVLAILCAPAGARADTAEVQDGQTQFKQICATCHTTIHTGKPTASTA